MGLLQHELDKVAFGQKADALQNTSSKTITRGPSMDYKAPRDPRYGFISQSTGGPAGYLLTYMSSWTSYKTNMIIKSRRTTDVESFKRDAPSPTRSKNLIGR